MECVPPERRTAAVYETVMEHSGLTWLFRNLGNLSKHGVLAKGRWGAVELACKRLTDAEENETVVASDARGMV